MPRILYRNVSGTVRSDVGYTEAEFGLMFRATDRATLNAGGTLTVNCGDPVGVILTTRPDRAGADHARPGRATAPDTTRTAGCPA